MQRSDCGFRRRQRRQQDELEPDYECVPRNSFGFKKRAKEECRLPIILPTGETTLSTVSGDCGFEQLRKKRKQSKCSDGDKMSSVDAVENHVTLGDINVSVDDDEEDVPVMSKAQLRRLESLRQEMEKKERGKTPRVVKTKEDKEKEEVEACLKRIASKKDALKEIAAQCELLVANPEAHIFRFDILWAVAHGQWDTVPTKNLTTDEAKRQPSTLALLSMGAVLQNCILGYQIRPSLNDAQVTRAVAATQTYEARLLKVYERFVTLLHQRFRSQLDIVTPIVAGLLLASPTFNGSDVLLEMCIAAACTVPATAKANHSSVSASVAIDCLQTLIKNDATLDVAVRVIRALGKTMKASCKAAKRGAVLKSVLLQMVSSINFTEKQALVERESNLRGTCSPGLVDTEVYKELMQSSIYGDIQTFKEKKTEIIRELCVIFLRVLRSPNQFPSDVLDASVEALGRLGSEVHLTLLAELIDELRRLVTEDSNRLGPGVMLSAITSVVRMSSVMRQNGQIPTDLGWIAAALTHAIYTALPRFASTSNAVSFPLLMTSAVSSSCLYPTCPEVHPNDQSDFANQIKASMEVLLKSSSFFDPGFAMSKEFIRLVQALCVTSCHVADPVCRVVLLDMVLMLLKKYPSLRSLMDQEGTILYGVGEEVSLFWTVSLLNTWQLSRATTQNLAKELLGFSQ